MFGNDYPAISLQWVSVVGVVLLFGLILSPELLIALSNCSISLFIPMFVVDIRTRSSEAFWASCY